MTDHNEKGLTDGSESDSIDNPVHPPAKCSKASTLSLAMSHTVTDKLKKRKKTKGYASSSGVSFVKGSTKVKKWSKNSKGKRKRVSSSSTSSTSCDSDSSAASDHVTSKKHCKQHSEKTRSTGLYSIFQKRYAVLEDAIQLYPEKVASKLFSKAIIPFTVMNEINTSSDTASRKASILLAKLCCVLKTNPEKLLALIDVLKDEECFDDVIQTLLGELSKYTDNDNMVELSISF